MSLKSPSEVVNIPRRNNNYSLFNKDLPLSDQGETIIGTYLVVLGWLSWFGNSLVIFILYKQKANLQPSEYLTFNLAISDACISVFGYSRGIIEIFSIFQDDGFIITFIWTCQVDGFYTLLFGLASINTLTLISVTRYIKACHAHKAHYLNKGTIFTSLIFVWCGAAFWAGMPLLGWGSYTDQGYGTCEVDWAKASFSTIYKSYVVSLFIFCFFIPVLVMVFCYMSIINAVKKGNAMATNGVLTERQRKMERDVTVVSVVICMAFILAWSPYALVSMWSAWGYHVPSLTSILARLFAKSASFYNPLIYFGLSARFRRDARALLLRPCSRRDTVAVELKVSEQREVEPPALAPPGTHTLLPLCAWNTRASQDCPKPLPSVDSGVESPPETIPPGNPDVFFISSSPCSATTRCECVRL